MSPEILLPASLGSSAIRAYINFDGGAGIDLSGSPQSRVQSKGVAALWYLLQKRGYAYLGDEVGMGKTRQAMGVIATEFLSNTNAHVVIVCPGRTLQEQWVTEWDTFLRTCYKGKDDRLVSALDGSRLQGLEFHDRLRDFARSLLLNESRIHLLRYSSFSRPIWFGAERETVTPTGVFAKFKECLREIGIAGPSPEEEEIVRPFKGLHKEQWEEKRNEMTSALNEAYAKRVGQLMKARKISLAVFDEAQYLRNLDNNQNTNIRHVFRGHAARWLFLSATPLHTGKSDIARLDAYLCTVPQQPFHEKTCKSCREIANPESKCTRVSARSDRLDIVDLLREFLVRRTRTYQDSDRNEHGKIHYREYRRAGVSGGDDPFTALTMALVQKQLVHALQGARNRFRQGECSSFESLSSSVRRNRKDLDGNAIKENELEQTEKTKRRDDEKPTPDRTFIDRLNSSFNLDMGGTTAAETGTEKYQMPHAKLNETTERLFDRHLRNGALTKSLVFVRRLDTVDELLDLLLVRFQGEVDRRLSLWRMFLQKQGTLIGLRERLWEREAFWTSRSAEDDDEIPEASEDETTAEQQEENPKLVRAQHLDYFQALKRKQKGKENTENGMLTSFQNRLLVTSKISSNPLRGFLLTPVAEEAGNPEASDLEEIRKGAQASWESFLEVVLDIKREELTLEDRHHWLFQQHAADSEPFWRVATLKRCIIQSLRQTDFIVDLYVLNRFPRTLVPGQKEQSLTEKLLWFLDARRNCELPADLLEYAENWKRRLKLWIDHFDLIVDKCLRGDDTREWPQIYERVAGVFARMSPVFGRSGRLKDKNAVIQFKFPTHPNILVCTDVLKEGVDMHLFCDEVVHYGVAWTSGDLEQRIGRVDRFGSLISRKIGGHSKSLPESRLPRLKVEFPYLDGTLDRHQVNRVIRAKIENDHIMDLGRRKDEKEEISLEDLESEEVLFPQYSTAEGVSYYPEGFSDDEETAAEIPAIVPTECHPRPEHLKNWSVPDAEEIHVPSLNGVVIRGKLKSASPESDLLRVHDQKRKGRKLSVVAGQEYLLPVDLVDGTVYGLQIPSLEAALQSGSPVAVTDLAGLKGFRFERTWNTMTLNVPIPNPFSLEERTQTVLLERVGEFWLLRTPLFHESATPPDQAASWQHWMTAENTRRKDKWGFLSGNERIIWFVGFVLDRGEAKPAWLEELAERIGKTGDRLQHLHSAVDDPEAWDYRSPLHFPAFFKIGKDTRMVLSGTGGTIMSMAKEDMRLCGQLFHHLHGWFLDAFRQVLNALYGVEIPDVSRELQVSPLLILPEGVLHLKTQGLERFQLQAFLELQGCRDDDAPEGPRLIWEVVATPNLMGAKPTLNLSLWEELPHMDSKGWSSERSGGRHIYTAVRKYRHLAVYYNPAAWDMSAKQMLTAWESVLPAIRKHTFRPRNFSHFLYEKST